MERTGLINTLFLLVASMCVVAICIIYNLAITLYIEQPGMLTAREASGK